MTGRQVIEVNFERLAQELGWWLDARAREGYGRELALSRAAMQAGTVARTLHRVLAGGTVSAELADRILLAIDYRDGRRYHPQTGRALPLVIRSRYAVDGRARQPGEHGRIKRVDFANAKLSEAQLRAIYRLHIDGGLSLRELCRRGFKQWGYASDKAALSSICDRLRSIGLTPRPPGEATARANQQRPNVEKPPELTRAQWRRIVRARRRATDPAYRAAELERIAELRAREGRAS